MAKIERFEDINVWKLSRELVRKIYSISSKGLFVKDYGLRDQIRRAAISVMSNIAEGFERASEKEFIQYLNISKGSVGEVRSQIYIAYDLKCIGEGEFGELKNGCEIISRQISNFVHYLRKSNKGFKPVRP